MKMGDINSADHFHTHGHLHIINIPSAYLTKLLLSTTLTAKTLLHTHFIRRASEWISDHR